MNKKKLMMISIYAGCALLLALAWIVTLGAKSDTEKQQILLARAQELIDDEIYIIAAPLLEEATGIDGKYTYIAEEMLKEVYLALSDNRGYSRLYISLLDKQMSRENVLYEVYIEAAEYYLSRNDYIGAMDVLRLGIERTHSDELTEYYEKKRYKTELNRNTFSYVTEIVNGYAGIEIDGKWGIANADGVIVIPCVYDKVSTVYGNRAIVMKDGDIFAVDTKNNRVAVAFKGVRDFGNFGDNRLGLLIDEGWVRASGEFAAGSAVFEEIGMYSGGYAAAKIDGQWGVIDIRNDWLIPAEYKGIIIDESGRCYNRGAVFIRNNTGVQLCKDGNLTDKEYQDAKPFAAEGPAAVNRNGKWGYIDTDGNVKIDFIFEDALSFNGHIAAVKQNGLWGYININGEIVIDAVYLEAKGFSGGSAPVLTEKGWQFLILKENRKEKKLI